MVKIDLDRIDYPVFLDKKRLTNESTLSMLQNYL